MIKKNSPEVWDQVWSDPHLCKDDELVLAAERGTTRWKRSLAVLTTRDRVLLTYTIRLDPLRPQVMYVGGYNGERGVGIATDFYTQTLPKLAKKMDVRFITGSNNEGNIDNHLPNSAQALAPVSLTHPLAGHLLQ